MEKKHLKVVLNLGSDESAPTSLHPLGFFIATRLSLPLKLKMSLAPRLLSEQREMQFELSWDYAAETVSPFTRRVWNFLFLNKMFFRLLFFGGINICGESSK